MNINQMFPKKYATGEDLNGKQFTLIIDACVQEQMHPMPGAAPVTKWVLHFENASKGVILSRTLAEQIAQVLGEETADWKGKKITIFPQPMRVAGKDRIAIRAKAPVNGTTPAPEMQEEEE